MSSFQNQLDQSSSHQNQISSASKHKPTLTVNSKEFGSRYQSKGEVYHFLSSDCGVYLSR